MSESQVAASRLVWFSSFVMSSFPPLWGLIDAHEPLFHRESRNIREEIPWRSAKEKKVIIGFLTAGLGIAEGEDFVLWFVFCFSLLGTLITANEPASRLVRKEGPAEAPRR